MMKKSGHIASYRLWVCSKNIFKDNIIFYLFYFVQPLLCRLWNEMNEWMKRNRPRKKDWNSKTKMNLCVAIVSRMLILLLCLYVFVYCPDCIIIFGSLNHWIWKFHVSNVQLASSGVAVWMKGPCLNYKSTHILEVTIPAAFQLSCVFCIFGAWLLKHFLEKERRVVLIMKFNGCKQWTSDLSFDYSFFWAFDKGKDILCMNEYFFITISIYSSVWPACNRA